MKTQNGNPWALPQVIGLLAWVLVCVGALPFSALANQWQLIWSDEFEQDGPVDRSKWGFDLGGGGWGNSEAQIYTDDEANARIENGRLVIEVTQEQTGRGFVYRSARLQTRNTFSFQYGRVEVRARVPRTTGTWSAIWMLPTDALKSPVFWPDNGEIDIMEHVGYEEDPLFLAMRGGGILENIHATLHTQQRNHLTSSGIGGRTHLPTATTLFHTYSLEWDADKMVFAIDGVEFFRVNRATDVGISERNPPAEIWPWWPFDQRFHLLLNVAVGGSWGGHFRTGIYPDSPYGSDGIDHNGVWPQRMEVEYVRVFQRLETSQWHGFEIRPDHWVRTEAWMGDIYVRHDPFVYSAALQRWLFVPAQETNADAAPGIWTHIFR